MSAQSVVETTSSYNSEWGHTGDKSISFLISFSDSRLEEDISFIPKARISIVFGITGILGPYTSSTASQRLAN